MDTNELEQYSPLKFYPTRGKDFENLDPSTIAVGDKIILIDATWESEINLNLQIEAFTVCKNNGLDYMELTDGSRNSSASYHHHYSELSMHFSTNDICTTFNHMESCFSEEELFMLKLSGDYTEIINRWCNISTRLWFKEWRSLGL